MRKILKFALFAAFMALAGYGVYTNQKNDIEVSDLAMANVEALARGEGDSLCPNGCISGTGGCACNGVYSYYWIDYPW